VFSPALLSALPVHGAERARFRGTRECARCARIIADLPWYLIAYGSCRATSLARSLVAGSLRRREDHHDDDADDDVDGADASRRSSRRGDVCEAGMRNPAVGGVSNGGARAGCGGEVR
jgi:hypothetical protein